ncbi:MAG: hypothetical protein H6658_08860 [Ardenticatenaceae bacterium]|nr:hypothetical protein [Ardenticatenaceae bacterium]
MSHFVSIVSHTLLSVKKLFLLLVLLLAVAGLTAVSHADPTSADDFVGMDGETAVLLPPIVTGPQYWATLMCQFSDVAAEPQNAAFFKDMFERTNGPSLADYWREVSYNNIPDITTDVYGWYTMAHDRAYYGFSESVPGYDALSVTADCIAAADTAVNFADYDAVAIMLNSPAPVAVTTTFNDFPDGAQIDINPITIPSNKYNLALVAHEMGHGYWLGHSSANGQEYANPWDLMGIASGYRCSVNADPIYGCLGQHVIAPFKEQVGWIPADKKFTAPQGISTITLERLAQPQTDNYLLATIESGFNVYNIEARQRVGYDLKLAGDAVLIHRSSDLIDADGSAPYDDAGAMWLPGETYTNAEAGFSVTVDSATATGFVITIHNQNQPGPVMYPQLSAAPAAPLAGEQVDMSAFIVYQDSSFGTADNVVVTVTFPSGMTYVPGSATTSIGAVQSENPLVFNIGTMQFSPLTLEYAATVNGNVTEPTALEVMLEISWDEGSATVSHHLIANAVNVYLPIVLR